MNSKLLIRTVALAFVTVFCGKLFAGPFPAFTDNGIMPGAVTAWATAVEDYFPAPGVTDTPGFPAGSPPIPNDIPTRGLGPADGRTVSLGDLSTAAINAGDPVGTVMVSFGQTIFDGSGPDLAVFENGGPFFAGAYIYAELAFVEVSSDGIDFARFPAQSLNIEDDGDMILEPNELDISFQRSFAGVDTTNIHNLAGVHPTLTGTPFDLSELAGDSLVQSGVVDLDNIRFIRFVDIPGNGAFLDSQNTPILDAWETMASGGFDLDAVGAIHAVPEPSTLVLLLISVLSVVKNGPRP